MIPSTDTARYQQIECREVLDPEMPTTGAAACLVVCVEAGYVKIGNVVTFKNTGEKRWFVTDVFASHFDKPNRGWGLDLPKSQRTER